MKNFFRNIVAVILGWQVRRLRSKNDFRVVAVAGSVGKTSTKLAIAPVLARKYPVCYQSGNYNDLVSVPLIFFGQKMPNIFNPLAWLTIFWRNEATLRRKYPYDIVVVELGSDKPGDLAEFGRYLRADVGVLTGITPEHMQFFDDLDAVAKEELVLASLSNELLVNKDLCPPHYLKKLDESVLTYAAKNPADYRIASIKFEDNLANFEVLQGHNAFLRARHESVSEPQLLAICAAAAVGNLLNMTAEEIEEGIRTIKPVSGRMRRLDGINDSTIIDDSYNASPEAMRAALDTLYRIKAPQKIAVLGNMNELGGYSQRLHEEVGRYCDPHELDLVVTIGPDAGKYLAPSAQANGCRVQAFDNPYSAGKYLRPLVEKGALILVKGSQNKVFAEETVNLLLANPADVRKLVRQSRTWLKVKRKSFSYVKI